mmetsp:Transcript_28690/g.75101  ORF Transcript_28690/g.75101 Transcript_28690/m.75101 type:complete len:175 (-) Transcript_28690:45-569(-)
MWLLPVLRRIRAGGWARFFDWRRCECAGDEWRPSAEDLAWEPARELKETDAFSEDAVHPGRLATTPEHGACRARPGRGAALGRGAGAGGLFGESAGAGWQGHRLGSAARAWPFAGQPPELGVLTRSWAVRTGRSNDRPRGRVRADGFTFWARVAAEADGDAADDLWQALGRGGV